MTAPKNDTENDSWQISVVIPIYNSAQSLEALIDRLNSVLNPLADELEIILVNDGSSDHSGQVVKELCRRFPHVRGIDLMRNYGQHNALLAGIRTARYETLVTLDDDLQNPPEEIPLLLKKLAEGVDVVYGTPKEEKHTLWRSLASQVTKVALQKTMGAETAQKVSAFRVVRARVCDAFTSYRNPYVNLDVLLTWGTSRFAALPVRHDPRTAGESNYHWHTLLTHALNMMTGFSTLPLRFASLVGFVFTLFGGAVLLFVLGRYWLEGGSVPGFAFLASIIALFSGAQLFALGVIGEYLARVHFGSMNRPPYAIRTTWDSDAGSARRGQDRTEAPSR